MNTKWISLFSVVCFSLPVSGFAQVFISPKGTGTISITYQNSYVNKHLMGRGENFLTPGGVKTSNIGDVRRQATYVDFAYSLTDRLAFSVSLPYIAAKYTAPANPPIAGFGPHFLINPDGTRSYPLDDGNYHGSFQDFDIRVRYNMWTHPLMITPFIEYVTPSNGYMFYSHAIVGNHVRELDIGTYVGSLLDPLLPNTYIQGRYSYGFPQEILGFSRRRHNAEVDVTYFIDPTIRAFGLIVGEVTNGGVNLPNDINPAVPTNPVFFHHAQISRDNILNVGGGLQYSLNNTVDLYGVVTHTITARNMHALDYELTIGMSWGFGGSPQRPCHC